MTLRVGAVITVLVLVWLPAAWASGDTDLDGPAADFWLVPPGERLVLEDTAPALAADPNVSPAAPESKPNWLVTSLISGGPLLGSALNSFLDGPHESDHPAAGPKWLVPARADCGRGGVGTAIDTEI